MFDIWNETNALAEQQYVKDNYCIKNIDKGGGYCVIYCSSNDIWFPNEEYAFRRSFIENDYYEWMGIRCRLASKEIYVRDIYKSWYVTGINKRINTIEKLVDLLRILAEGRPIICIGSSSGGYLAALLSSILRAEYAIVFSAQFELRTRHALEENPLLQKYCTDCQRAKYYSITEQIRNSGVPIFYVYPNKSETDVQQCQIISGVPNVHALGFNSRHHGVVLYRSAISELISRPFEGVTEFFAIHNGKKRSPFVTSIELAGFHNTLQDLIYRALRYLKRKVKTGIVKKEKRNED